MPPSKQTFVCTFSLLAALLALPATASANTLAVVVDAGADSALAQTVFATATQATQAAGLRLVPVKINAISLAICLPVGPECTADVLSKVTADYVLLLSVKKGKDREGEPRVVLTGRLLAPKVGEVLLTEQRFCQRCFPPTRLTKYVRQLAASLARSATNAGRKTFVVVQSHPPGARVLVDGTPIGTTSAEQGLRYSVLPGPHTVSVDLPGTPIATRTITAVAGQSARIDIDLDPGREAPASRFGPWKWAALGAGAAAVAVGATLVAIDDPSVDGGSRQPENRLTGTAGVLSLAGGAALVGTGVVLWILDKNSPSGGSGPANRAATVGAGVFVAPGQAFVTFAGAF